MKKLSFDEYAVPYAKSIPPLSNYTKPRRMGGVEVLFHYFATIAYLVEADRKSLFEKFHLTQYCFKRIKNLFFIKTAIILQLIIHLLTHNFHTHAGTL